MMFSPQDRTSQVTSQPKPAHLFDVLALHNDFRHAQTQDEYEAAVRKWAALRPHLVEYEKENKCDQPGDPTPLGWVIDRVNDQVGSLKSLIALAKVLLAFVGQEKEELVDALKETLEEAKKYGWNLFEDKINDKIKDKSRPRLRQILARLESAIISYLRSLKKRSPKYYREVLRKAAGAIKGIGGLTFEVIKLLLDPIPIAAELCGVLKEIDQEERSASYRIIGRPFGSDALPDTLYKQTAPNVLPKLELGRVDDSAERDAEAAADRVMRMQDGGACCSACVAGGPCASHAPHIEHGLAMPLRRTVAGVGNSAGLPVPADLEPQVRRATSGGAALPATVRAFFEPRFGEDLSHVRIHRDTDAAESARALGAKAYTLGSHIAFSAGRWAPGTDAGDRLIAHELAHVTANGEGPIRREVEPDDGTCLRGAMTPMAAGRAAHKQIQTAAKAFEIDAEAGIPKKASKGVPRADLFGVWTEPEARRRGLPTTRTPENDTPWVIAEIGEIKPVSYAQGGIRHAQARKEIADYLKDWERFSKVPAIPMRSLRSIGPFEFMGSELFCDLDFPVDGLYIYRCSKLRDPKQELVPVRIPEETQDAVKRELRKFRDVEQFPTMKPEQLRQRLADDMPQLLSLLRQFVVTISVAAAIVVVVALLVLAFPLLVEASAVAAALLLAASSA
jgi:hypothetical protein